jgi:protein-S-isoprenylcysteine O-methyltransferase Ste14
MSRGVSTPVVRRRRRLAEALARKRVSIGFLSGAAALWLAQPTRSSLFVGAAVGACGEALRVWAAGHLEKSREVTTSGPYRFMRHPLYAGSTVMGAGLAIAADSIVVAALVLGYLGVTLTAAIRTEEAHLTDKFGDRYPSYRQGTIAPAPRRFSLARAMKNREYRAAIGFAAVLALLALKRRA